MGKSVNQIVRILIIILFYFAAESGIAQVADFAGKVGEIRNSHNYEDLRRTGITSKLISESYYQNIRFKSSLLKEKSKYQKSIESGPKIGEEKDFFVRDILAQNTWNTTTAVLSYSEAGINIWVQKTAYDTLLGTTLWTEVQQRFDEFLYQSTPSHSVLPEVGVLEIIDRYVGKFPDVDNDQTLDVLLLDIQDNFEGTGSFVAGFFDPVNLYEFEFSNRRDLIYLDLYPTIFFDGEIHVERAVSTFAHESQHLIHAGYEGEEAELVFVNEGFSEAVEILCGFEPRSEKEFQRHPLRKLTGWDHENPIPDYSRASLWMHYLIEQLGAESFKYFIQNPTTGINGYREVIESISTFTFEEMFQNWGMALTLNDTGQNSKYGYQHELRKHRILYPQIVFNNLPTIFNEKLSGFINFPVSFSLTKELQFDTGLPSMSNTRVSSISTYPGIDEKEIQVNSHSFLTVNADKWKFGDVEVLLSSYEDADSSYSSVLSFMGDGEKSGQDLRWGYGEGNPEKFYMNASYLMLNDDESLGIIFPPNESEYWLKDIKLWTLFKSELEGTEQFPDELTAVKHFEQARWKGITKCAYCGSDKVSKRKKDHRFTCLNCNKSFSVTVNTMLHKTRIPLRRWLIAFSLVTDAKKGVSAKQLQRNLGVSYKTAWRMGMKMRKLMREAPVLLDDVVEMDETYVGGKPRKGGLYTLSKSEKAEYDKTIAKLESQFDISEGKRKKKWVPAALVKRGRGTRKIPVVGIAERDGKVVAKVMDKLSHENLKAMVQKHVEEEDAVLITDKYSGYNRLDKIIEHIKVDHEKMYSYRGVNTNTIESFWAIIKRGIMGQYHKVSLKYLPDYITEFVFKYNNRNEDDMFETLVKNAMKPNARTHVSQ